MSVNEKLERRISCTKVKNFKIKMLSRSNKVIEKFTDTSDRADYSEDKSDVFLSKKRHYNHLTDNYFSVFELIRQL